MYLIGNTKSYKTEEQLFNPWDGKPETKLERIKRLHTEAWAPTVKDNMEACTTWEEVTKLYEEHNKVIKGLHPFC